MSLPLAIPSARAPRLTTRIAELAKSYPLVVAILAIGIITLIFAFALPNPDALMFHVFGRVFSLWNLLIIAWCLFIAGKALWSMIQDLRHGNLGLDILAVTAIIATLLVGEYWAALVIVLMVTGGEALEDYADGRAKRDLTALMSNAPQTAHRIDADGNVQNISASNVQIGDKLVVRSHEVVPVDGTLLSDTGSFDESSLTGEAIPREIVQGENVLSGSICGSDSVTIQATKAASDSQYQQIVSLVSSAAASRSPMVRLADRYAVPFTIVAFAIAGFAWWWAAHLGLPRPSLRFAQVLVVATPCPLLIAAPVAFMAGMSRATRRGIVIRSSGTLEKLSKAKSFAFDKTGTLTKGHPEFAKVKAVPEFSENELLAWAASAETGSAHILADAIVSGAQALNLPVPVASDVREDTGGGVSAEVSGHRVAVGKHAYIQSQIGSAPPEPKLAPGELSVLVAVDGQYAGAIIMRDQLRPESPNTIRTLQANGVERVAMFTGDGAGTANYIAGKLGITDVHANCLPADKLNGVRSMQPAPVVMVGDGVNDAPVLAAADVGVAMAARGSTAASESADVVILPDDLGRVAEAQQIGRDTVRVALQSIWIGIVISIGLMLFAATGRLPAVAGAWLQELVDVISILWALRAGGRFLARRRGMDHFQVFTGHGADAAINAARL